MSRSPVAVTEVEMVSEQRAKADPAIVAARAAVEAALRPGGKSFSLEPLLHPDRLPAPAAQLKSILLRPDVRDLAKKYDQNDRRAEQAQKTYLGLRKRTIWMTCFTVVVAAALAIFPPGRWLPAQYEFYAVMLFLGILFLHLVGTLYFGGFKTQQYWHDEWLACRAAAEHARCAYFERIFVEQPAEDSASGALPLLPLKLEYFVTHQLGPQLAYFEKRGLEHGKEARLLWRSGRSASQLSSESLIVPAIISLLLLAVAYSPIAEQGPTGVPLMAAVSNFGHRFSETDIARGLLLILISFTSLSAALFARSLLNNPSRNARRYQNRLENLRRIEAAGLAKARAAALVGQPDGIDPFVRSVHELLLGELQAWIVLTEPEARMRIRQAVS